MTPGRRARGDRGKGPAGSNPVAATIDDEGLADAAAASPFSFYPDFTQEAVSADCGRATDARFLGRATRLVIVTGSVFSTTPRVAIVFPTDVAISRNRSSDPWEHIGSSQMETRAVRPIPMKKSLRLAIPAHIRPP